MAAAKKPKKDSGNGLAADESAVIPRISLSETGFIGLRSMNGAILDEANLQFRYPQFLRTVAEMRTDPTIMAALNSYRMLIAGAKWCVEPPEDATETDIKRAEFVESCIYDMETSWSDVMSEIITYLEYGFSVQEKVYRRRLTRNGSKFNDGLVGLRKIVPRSQDTIKHWNFSDDGRELVSIGQSLRNMQNGARYQNLASSKDGLITIDRAKFLLFSADSVKGNPEGKSILKSVYLPYKQLTLLKDQLLLGVAKDLASVPVVGLPPKLMDPDASVADKTAYQAYQTIVNNIAAGTQRGLVLPLIYDDNGNKLFDFNLLEAKGGNKYDIPKIIADFQKDILDGLSCDVIGMGKDTNSTFTIGKSLLVLAAKHRLNEIKSVLNSDLIPQLYALNGWSQEKLPCFEFGDIVAVDMETFGKFTQQAVSVGALEMDRPVMNRVREVFGVDGLPEETEVDKNQLAPNMTGKTTGASEGMTSPVGDGTRKDPHGNKDSSTSNANNK